MNDIPSDASLISIQDGKDFIPQVQMLIIEYTRALGRDLSFQNLDEELNDIQGKYCPPNGELRVAVSSGKAVGMVAYHRLSPERCEMKRLYVTPEARGLKLGEMLVGHIIEAAQDAGYREMVLDTIRPLKAAIHLYEKNGFSECAPYYDNPMPDVIYMRKELCP